MYGFFPSDEYGDHFDNQPAPREPSKADLVLEGLLSELPDTAQSIVSKVTGEIDKIQEKVDDQVSSIRAAAEEKVAAVEAKADDRRKALLQHAVDQLEPLQKDLFRVGDFEKALATFVQIRTLKSQLLNILPNPGNLLRFEHIGKSYQFRVTGTDLGPVWGTDIYTSDSDLSTAAVHAGVLEIGEQGVVRVTMVDMSGMQVRGSISNGVVSHDWESYPVGYRVSRYDAEQT